MTIAEFISSDHSYQEISFGHAALSFLETFEWKNTVHLSFNVAKAIHAGLQLDCHAVKTEL